MSQPPRIGMFPGTFDPITNGHIDVIQRGMGLFDLLIVAVGHNPAKRELFTVSERLEMIRALIDPAENNIQIDPYDGLTVDYAKNVRATPILRGLRNVTDLNYEFQLALTNRSIADIETIFIMTGEPYGFTSSTLIKQIASSGDIDQLHRLLPPLVIDRLKQKKRESGGALPWQPLDGLTD